MARTWAGRRERTTDTFRALGLAPRSSHLHEAQADPRVLLLEVRTGLRSHPIRDSPTRRPPPWKEKPRRRGNSTPVTHIQSGAHLPDTRARQGAVRGARDGRNAPQPNRGGEPKTPHLVAILFPKIKDGCSPFSGGIRCIKNLGPNQG